MTLLKKENKAGHQDTTANARDANQHHQQHTDTPRVLVVRVKARVFGPPLQLINTAPRFLNLMAPSRRLRASDSHALVTKEVDDCPAAPVAGELPAWIPKLKRDPDPFARMGGIHPPPERVRAKVDVAAPWGLLSWWCLHQVASWPAGMGGGSVTGAGLLEQRTKLLSMVGLAIEADNIVHIRDSRWSAAAHHDDDGSGLVPYGLVVANLLCQLDP